MNAHQNETEPVETSSTQYVIQSQTAAATRRFGMILGQLLRRHLAMGAAPAPDDTSADAALVVALCGELGAGKTTLTQGIAAGFGVAARVTSPTFTLINEYTVDDTDDANHAAHGSLHLVHVDSYRLGSQHLNDAAASVELEASGLGLDEFLAASDTLVVIEWADRLATLLPGDHLSIALAYANAAPDQAPNEDALSDERDAPRRIACTAHGPASAAIVRELAAWMDENAPASVTTLSHV